MSDAFPFRLVILTPEFNASEVSLLISNCLVSCQSGFLVVSYLFQFPREALKEERIF